VHSGSLPDTSPNGMARSRSAAQTTVDRAGTASKIEEPTLHAYQKPTGRLSAEGRGSNPRNTKQPRSRAGLQPRDDLWPDVCVRLPAGEDREMLEPDADLARILNDTDVCSRHRIDERPNRRWGCDFVGGIHDHQRGHSKRGGSKGLPGDVGPPTRPGARWPGATCSWPPAWRAPPRPRAAAECDRPAGRNHRR
jgi:hypothetical protein